MKVVMLTRYAGPDGNYAPNQVVDLDTKVANKLIKGGYARKHVAKDEKETAEAPDGEKATE